MDDLRDQRLSVAPLNPFYGGVAYPEPGELLKNLFVLDCEQNFKGLPTLRVGLVRIWIGKMQSQGIDTAVFSHQCVRVVILVQPCELDILKAPISVPLVMRTD